MLFRSERDHRIFLRSAPGRDLLRIRRRGAFDYPDPDRRYPPLARLGAHRSGDDADLDALPRRLKICKEEDLKIPGTHNLENALAAVAISYFAGIELAVIQSVLNPLLPAGFIAGGRQTVHKARKQATQLLQVCFNAPEEPALFVQILYYYP